MLPKGGEADKTATANRERELDLLKRKLEHLRVEQAKNADPLRGFQLKEEIQTTQAQIEEIEAERISIHPGEHCQLADDLENALTTGRLRQYSFFGSRVQRCLATFTALQCSADYDFASFERVVRLADEPLQESIDAFKHGKDEFAKEELVRGLGMLVVGIALCCEPSQVLSQALMAVCSAVLNVDEILRTFDPACERDLYRAAIMANSPRDGGVEAVLHEGISP